MVPTIKIKGFRCSVEEAVFSNRKDSYAHVLSLSTSHVCFEEWRSRYAFSSLAPSKIGSYASSN
jgi:hypothetical protein